MKKMLIGLCAVLSVASASAYIIKVEKPFPSPGVKITTLPIRKKIDLSSGYKTEKGFPAVLMAAQLELELLSGPHKGTKRIVNIPPKLMGKDIRVFIDTHTPQLGTSIKGFTPRF